MAIFTVYLITNTVNGKRYVGITSKTLRERWLQHTGDDRKSRGYPLKRAIRKYGVSSFEAEDLAVVADQETACDIEVALIAFFRTLCRGGWGYNQTAGGEGFRGTHSEESRDRMSKSQKRLWSGLLGEVLRENMRRKTRARFAGPDGDKYRAASARGGAAAGRTNYGALLRPESVKKRTKFFMTHAGETLTIPQWAERTGLKIATIRFRVASGWSVFDTLTRPNRQRQTRN